MSPGVHGPWYVRTLGILTLLAIIIIATMAYQANPQVYRNYTFIPATNSGVTFQGFSRGYMLSVLFIYSTVCIFGYALARRFLFAFNEVDLLTRLISAFWLGYVAVAGSARIISLFVPYNTGSYYIIFFLGLYILLSACYSSRGWGRQLLSNFSLNSVYSWFTADRAKLILAGLPLLIIILVFQVCQGDFAWIGHQAYSHWLKEWASQGLPRFPIPSQHYDELIFHWATTFSPLENVHPSISPWLTLGLVKVSAWAFIYMCFRKLTMAKLDAGLCSSFIMLGSFSLLPNKYFVLFDGGNPVMYSMYIGRVITLPAVLMIIFDLFIIQQNDSKRCMPIMGYIFLGIGFSTFSINVLPWLVTISLLGIMFSRANWVQILQDKKMILYIGILVWGSCIACIALYSIPFSEKKYIYIRLALIIAILVSLVVLIRSIITFPNAMFFGLTSEYRICLRKALTLGLSGAVGILFLGNIFANNGAAIYVNTLFCDGPNRMVFRDISPEPELLEIRSGMICDHRELGAYNEYSVSGGHFVAYYGGVISLILLGFFGNLRRVLSDSSGRDPTQTLFGLFFVCVASLPILLFIMDFVNITRRAWNFSRFLEIPVYMILFTSLQFLFRKCGEKEEYALRVYLLTFILGPVIATERISQLWENFKVVLHLIADG